MGRTRNPRIITLGKLRVLRHELLTMLDRWKVAPRVPLELDERTEPGVFFRDRKPWEYPEHDIAQWRVLLRELRHVDEQVADLRRFVTEQIDSLRCTSCGSDLPGSEARAGFTTCEHCPAPAAAR